MTIICSPQLFIRALGRCPNCGVELVPEDVRPGPEIGLQDQHRCGSYLPVGWQEALAGHAGYLKELEERDATARRNRPVDW